MSDNSTLHSDVQAALVEVRREELKAAAIYGAVDGAAVGAAVGLIGTVFDIEAVIGVSRLVEASTFTMSLTAGLSVGLAVLTFLGEIAYRTRGEPCEHFEAATITVAPTLRTAREVSTEGRTDPMAARLYEDVLADLKQASSENLLRRGRLVAPLVVMSALSFGTIYVAASNIEVTTGVGSGPSTEDTADLRAEGGVGDTTLQDGESVLGEATNVSAGNDPLNTTISADASGGDRPDSEPASSGFESSSQGADVDAQRTGYSDPEEIEDATVIKDYSVAIRDDDQQERD
jgi:hypothetical protein